MTTFDEAKLKVEAYRADPNKPFRVPRDVIESVLTLVESYPIKEVGRKLGFAPKQIRRWKEKYQPEACEPMPTGFVALPCVKGVETAPRQQYELKLSGVNGSCASVVVDQTADLIHVLSALGFAGGVQ